MWRMCMSVLVSGWILTVPAMWVHRPEQMVLSALLGLAGIVLSFAAVIRPRLGLAIFAVGAVRAISTFVFPDGFGTNADNLTSGLLLVIAGIYPSMTVIAAQAAIVERRPAERRPEERRLAA
jgi:hypothetical protein